VPERIEIVAELRPGPPVQADPTELDQVVLNLVVNAADAIPAIGQIVIGTGTADHDAAAGAGKVNSRPEPHARLTVADTGVGMDATVQAHMFEPFFTTKGGGGTGLGLATVYGIVERMGGTIGVSSTPGHGSVFEIDLPASPSTGGLTAATSEPAAVRGTERILVVEDEATVRSFASTALVRLGYSVIAAGGPADAVLIPASDYDMIITDVVMPGMDGTELARNLRLKRPDLPVLFVSGYSRGTVADDFIGEPRTTLLAKPYTLAELANAARKLLDEHAKP
jgi:CheY-like chemotaxis protein